MSPEAPTLRFSPGDAAGTAPFDPPLSVPPASAVRAPAECAGRLDALAPRPAELALALAGYLALGAAFAMPARSPLFQLGSFAVAVLGSLAFTTPTLLVLHSAWGFSAAPESLLRAIAWVFVRHGRVALALTPLALLFVLAGSAGRTLFWTMFVMLGALGHWTVYRALHAVESGGRPSAFLPAAPLFFAWSVLTGMVGLALVASYRAVIP